MPRYAVGLAIFFVALMLRCVILPQNGGIPFLTFYPAVTFAALLCGTGPALMVIVLGGLSGNYFFMVPYYTITCTPGAIAAMAVFTLSGLLICMIVYKNRKQEAAQALLAAIVVSSENAIISKTIKGIITSWNSQAENLFGYTAAEAIGKPMTMLIPPDRHDEEAELLARVARGERVSHYETIRLCKNSSTVEVSVTLSPIRDQLGRIVGVSNIAHDISERRAQEAAQALLAAIVDSCGDAIISKSMQGLITSWNPAAQRMFGYTAEEIIGRRATLLYPRELMYEEETLNSRNANGEFIERFETMRRRKDGSLVQLSSSLSPIMDRSGHVTGVSVIAHDITEQKALEASQSLLASIVACSSDAILSKSMQGLITSWNAAAEKVFGYTAEEVLGRPSTILYPPDQLNEAQELFSRNAKGESITQFEAMRLRKDGSKILLSSSLSPIRDRLGHMTGVSIIAHDITERKALEEAMKQANQRVAEGVAALKRSNLELEEFARVAAHDLKEPLRGIHNYVSFLLEDYASLLDEQGRNYLSSMQRLAKRMGVLIDCLLDYSRLGSAPLTMEAVNLEAVLNEVAEDLKLFLIDHGVELRRPVRLPVVTGNAIRLGELLQNLIANGAKYNDKQEKWVEVGCDDSKATPVYSVRDNGIGIPEQHQESVFGIFKRLHTQDKFGGGTGAGLTLARKIVERHGGRIWLRSTPGQGTTFHFTLAAELPELSPAKGGS